MTEARRAALLALAERCEKASEGSEELDLAVHRVAFGQVIGNRQTYTPWTRSLDAAVTLAPEGAVWHVMTDYGDLNRAKVGPANNPSATVYGHAHDRPMFIVADAATPALALTAAALKARAAMEEE